MTDFAVAVDGTPAREPEASPLYEKEELEAES